MSDKMRVWDAVSKTNPNHTKKVNQRGGFTAIDAQYQVMNATQQFGPIGEGWGYTAGSPIFQDKFVLVPVELWHGNRENVFGPVYGCCEMFGNRPDADAPKKAGTDGLTKLLSQLGFNADVFLGKFDDNKYVAEVSAEFAPKPEPSEKTKSDERDPRAIGDWIIGKCKNAATYAAIDTITSDPKVMDARDWLSKEAPPINGEVNKAVSDARTRVDPAGQRPDSRTTAE